MKGYKKDLDDDDLYRAPTEHQSQFLGDFIEDQWQLLKNTRKNSTVLDLLWKCFGLKYLTIGVLSLAIKSIIIITQPYALAKFIAYFSPSQTLITANEAANYATLTIFLTIIDNLSFNNLHLLELEIGIKARTAICSLIYRKILKLPAIHQDYRNGYILTSITKDVETFNDFVTYINQMWTGVIKSLIATVVLYNGIGIFALLPIVIFVLILPIQTILLVCCTKMRLEACQQTDNRLQITKEAITAIKIIKMYGIETFYQRKIDQARRRELEKTLIVFVTKTVILLVGEITRHIGFFSMLLTYLYFGNNVTAEIFFFMLRLYQHIALTFSSSLPKGLNAFAEFHAAVKRINSILNWNEFDYRTNLNGKPQIQFDNVSIEISDKLILNNINFNMKSGLTILTGPTASGKSILLKTIAGIHPINSGDFKITGFVSYACQEIWLFPSTIRQNILFGEKFDPVRYNEVIRVCALDHDLQRLPHGDQTIVEDDGRNFSGGQQVRINLARAIYRKADIYLLDSCLSALDVQVADSIFKQCILRFLNGKLVILVDYNNRTNNEFNSFQMRDGKMIKNETFIPSSITNTIDDDYQDGDQFETLLKPPNSNRIYKEKHKSGQVNYWVYYQFMKFGGGAGFFFIVFSVFLGAQILESYEDVSVSQWIDLLETSFEIIKQNNTNHNYNQIIDKANRKFTINIILEICVTSSSLLRALVLFLFTVQVSKCIHKTMIRNVLNATIEFFDHNFNGTILNRFSKDINVIDDIVPMMWYNFFMTILLLTSTVLVIVILDWILFIVVIIFFIILAIIRWVFLKTARHLKRLDASTRSPVVGYLQATIKGLPIIQTSQKNGILIKEFDQHQNLYTSTTFTLQATIRAFSFLIQIICIIFIVIVISSLLIFETNMMAGRVGLIISQCFLLTEKLESGIRSWIEIENQMTSVERAIEFTTIKQERNTGVYLEKIGNTGRIDYRKVSLNYNNQQILTDISFEIRANEKIAIVGRTGAGKSSLISTIFRLYRIDGAIFIDNIDIKTISIELLRSKISIIPQLPFIFTGTLRENIDPLQQFTDDEIKNTLTTIHLDSFVSNLDMDIDGNQRNYFSIGQRQLICIARALIRKNKIVILDEPTSNIDHEMAGIIQNVLNKNFIDCTMLIVTHDLETALQSDRIIVIDSGEIVQFDTPKNLLNNTNGLFFKMLAQSNR